MLVFSAMDLRITDTSPATLRRVRRYRSFATPSRYSEITIDNSDMTTESNPTNNKCHHGDSQMALIN